MAEAHKRANRHPKYKTSYRIKNWPQYEQSLRNRGDITVWLSRDSVDAWTPLKNGKRGGQPIYSDIVIETSLTLRLVFHLPLRQAAGFLKSILKLMDLYLPCPDHTTVSRRNRSANILTTLMGNVLTEPVGKVLDIYRWPDAYIHVASRPLQLGTCLQQRYMDEGVQSFIYDFALY